MLIEKEDSFTDFASFLGKVVRLDMFDFPELSLLALLSISKIIALIRMQMRLTNRRFDKAEITR